MEQFKTGQLSFLSCLYEAVNINHKSLTSTAIKAAWASKSPIDHLLTSALVVSIFNSISRFNNSILVLVANSSAVASLKALETASACCVRPANEAEFYTADYLKPEVLN